MWCQLQMCSQCVRKSHPFVDLQQCVCSSVVRTAGAHHTAPRHSSARLLRQQVTQCSYSARLPHMLQSSALGTDAETIRAYIQAGGGLLTGAQAWYWTYNNPVELHPSNILLGPTGIYLTGYSSMYDASFGAAMPSQLGNGEYAIAVLEASFGNDTSSPLYTTSSSIITNAISSVTSAAGVLPLASSFWTKLQQVRVMLAVPGIGPLLDGYSYHWLAVYLPAHVIVHSTVGYLVGYHACIMRQLCSPDWPEKQPFYTTAVLYDSTT